MSSIALYLPTLLCGVAFYVLFLLWRKSATRWSTWFPLLKKTLEWSLIGAAVLLSAYTVSTFFTDGVQLGAAALALAVGVAAPELVRRRGGSAQVEETKRGATVGEEGDVARRIRKAQVPTYLDIGGMPIPVDAETYHFLFAGSTGTGKSVAINALLDRIRERGDTAIVVDSGGDFLAKHYREGTDFVFNPYDERCVGWSPTLEMQGVWDAQALARSIVPDGVGDSKEWNSYAQTFIASVLRALWERDRLTLADFLHCVQAASREELSELLAGTPAASQLSAERTFGSIRTIASNYVSTYDHLPSGRPGFSVSEMVRAEHSGMLFLTYRDDQLDSLRNIIACVLDVASRTILSLTPNPQRRVWLIIDEFASIGRVQSIEAVATKARKAGGCLVVGLQSVSQLKDRYGDNGAQTILSCLSTWLVLRCADADTAEYMSKYIGDAEVLRTQRSKSASDTGDTHSLSEQSATQRAVLGSQIQAMKNLHGFLKLAGDYPVCEVDLKLPARRPAVEPPFVQRDYLVAPLLPSRVEPIARTAPRAEPPRPASAAKAAAQMSEAPAFSDRTPRPRRDATSADRVPRNRLVEAARGAKPLLERVRETATRLELAQQKLRASAPREAASQATTRTGSSAGQPAPQAPAPQAAERTLLPFAASRPGTSAPQALPPQTGLAKGAGRLPTVPEAVEPVPESPGTTGPSGKRKKGGRNRDMLNELLR